jgi:prevent-host-death family protein
MIVNMHEAKVHLSKYIEKTLAGEEVILAKAGKPLVALVPVSALESKKSKRVVLGVLEGTMNIPADFDKQLPEEICDEFYPTDL